DWILPIERVTPEDGHYFFGYFDKYQIDQTERFLLVNKAHFMHRQPRADDELELGLIDIADNNSYHPLTKTYAWCWQQGCMLQWLPGGKSTEFIYNDRRNGQFVAVKADIERGELEVFPRPIYALSPDGKWALSVNFARLAAERPGYGYEGVPDPWEDELHPEEDGIYAMNLENSEYKLIISLDQLAHFPPNRRQPGDGKHWSNHLAVSPNCERFMFLHRWKITDGSYITRFFTSDREGNNIRLLNDCNMTSHMGWIDDHRIIAFANRDHWGYYIFFDGSSEVREVGAGLFDDDGHCTCSTDGRWMLTDTYWHPVTNERTLILYDMKKVVRYNLGYFWSDPNLPRPARCDLHPRWSRDEKMVTFDSLHEGFRGVYAMDISSITTAMT
ncbi:MAG: hypothetical protein ACOCZS_03730, partial [Verrucomicrobiota bacterium]